MKCYLIMGAPGAGKGTQASLIKNHFNIAHISTGEMFREAISSRTPVGMEAKKYIDKGNLVPDDITVYLVKERIHKDDCKNGFILDGFPRNINQAIALDKLLHDEKIQLGSVINIVTDDKILTERIVGRRTCPTCNEGYHIVTKKPLKEGICDKCGTPLIQRADDDESVVTSRLNVYHNQTAPLLDYYSKGNLIISIDGMQDIDDVFNDIKKAWRE